MALAQDLMGLGEAGERAARLAGGGTGPVTLTAAGTNAGTAAQIYGGQYVVYVNAGTGHVILPAPTGTADLKPLIYDNFVIHNGLTSSLTVWAPSGVTVNVGGSNFTNSTPFTLATLKTLTVWTGPTTTQWFGLSS